jgi:DUF4097 and DUF4098 domain-containing protein YvlB
MPCTRTLLFAALLSLGSAVVAGPISAQTTRTITRSFSLDRDGHVELEAFSGSIEVTGRDRRSVEVEARIEGDDELVDATALRFKARDRDLSIEVDYDEVEDRQQFLGLFNFGNVDRPDVDVVISMPRSASLTVDAFSSDVEVEGLRAGATLEAFSSSVALRDVEGAVDVETFSGAVEGDGLRGSVQVETFSGDVQLQKVALMDDSHFETFSGNVELSLPPDAGFEVVGKEDLFGNLTSEFSLRADEGRRIAGDGGPRLEVDTFSGDLHLRKQ